MSIQPTAFQQPLRTIPENKGAVFGIAHFAQLIDANAGIGCGFFQRQIAFLPDRNLSGLGPSILLRKTVPSLKVPTGDFIASQTRISFIGKTSVFLFVTSSL